MFCSFRRHAVNVLKASLDKSFITVRKTDHTAMKERSLLLADVSKYWYREGDHRKFGYIIPMVSM